MDINPMETLNKLLTKHSKLLWLIAFMEKSGSIDHETKLKLKYMVFLNDANLLNVLKKGYTDINDMIDDIRAQASSIEFEALEEAVKNAPKIVDQ